MAATGKKVVQFFDKVVESYEEQAIVIPLVKHFNPGNEDMQNSGDVAWQSVEQHAPIIDGFDTTGQETDIIQETVPMALGTPKNDVVEQRVDDLRDPQFWDRRAKVSGKRQVAELNKGILSLINSAGSLYYNTASVSGFDAIGEAGVILDQRQKAEDGRVCMLNPSDNFKFASDLAGRQTFAGRPENAYGKGSLGLEVGDFMAYKSSSNPTIVGNVLPDAATTATLSDKPEGGSENSATNTVTNIDYRFSTIAVPSANYSVGDKVQFDLAAGGSVLSIGLHDKTISDRPITATIVAKPDGASITVYPKIIALDDPATTALDKAYANVDTQIISGTTVTKINNFAGNRTANLFWCKDAIQVTGGNAPLGLLNEYGGMKVISTTMSNGQIMYMAYDGDINTLKFKMRVFTWYGITMLDPSACGSFTLS